jgi:hypothetical protein
MLSLPEIRKLQPAHQIICGISKLQPEETFLKIHCECFTIPQKTFMFDRCKQKDENLLIAFSKQKFLIY